MKLVVAVFFILSSLFVQAQQNDSRLAYTYYQNKEYEKAAGLFLQLYERTRSSNYLDYHIICLINGKQYDKAEEVLKKFLKTDETNKDFLINLGYIYEQQGKLKKSNEYYEKAIKKLIPQSTHIRNLGYKFRNIREYDWAIKTYKKGQELLHQPNAFINELGDCYMMQRDYENMLSLFLQDLQLNPANINSITSKLSFARSNDMVNNVDQLIEKRLTELLRQNDYNPIFDELAVWYALQKKNYAQALQHATLLNQKAENKLHLFFNVARDASNAGEYDVAIETYQKVIAKGKDNNNYYIPARKEILNCQYEQYRHQQADSSLFRQVADDCETYLQEYSYNSTNIDIALLLSDLYAYQLQQTDTANRILEKCINLRRLNANILHQLKSKRADLLVFMDNPWEATILYTQIEKANPNNDIGYEAKLKKAWLAYYAGDLLWAKAQFDVLKGATTKLISNDAILMSHFINMNYNENSDNSNLERLARTEYLIYKQANQPALPILDSLIKHAEPGIAERATLKKVHILNKQNHYAEAIQLLNQLKNNSSETYIQAEAIYELANLYARRNAFPQAQELYKLLVSEYSGSVYSIEAGKQYREIEKSKN